MHNHHPMLTPYVRPKVGDQVDAAESEATQRHLHQFRKEKKQNDKMQKLLAVCGTNVRVRSRVRVRVRAPVDMCAHAQMRVHDVTTA